MTLGILHKQWHKNNLYIQFWAKFLQKSLKLCETWPPYIFGGEDLKYFCFESKFLMKAIIYAYIFN